MPFCHCLLWGRTIEWYITQSSVRTVWGQTIVWINCVQFTWTIYYFCTHSVRQLVFFYWGVYSILADDRKYVRSILWWIIAVIPHGIVAIEVNACVWTELLFVVRIVGHPRKHHLLCSLPCIDNTEVQWMKKTYALINSNRVVLCSRSHLFHTFMYP